MNRLDAAATIADLRLLARARVPAPIFDYIDGAALHEETLAANVSAFSRLKLRQRVGLDIANRDLSTTLFGRDVAMPLVLAPTGATGFVDGSGLGEIAVARAAAHANIPYTLAMVSLVPMERIADVHPGFWFQVCPLSDSDLLLGLISRAEAAGSPVLVVTMTWPMPSIHPRLIRYGPGMLPPSLHARAVAHFARQPRWALRAAVAGKPRLVNLERCAGRPIPLMAVRDLLNPSFTWDDLARLRDRWRGRLLVKGIIDAEDAEQAMRAGADGVVVSNHGGNQLDGAPATIEALPFVASAVGKRGAVLLDGGIRSGRDIFRALASGADAVLAGRAYLYGLAAAREAGVAKALEILRRELDVTAGLTGCRSVRDAGPAVLWPA